MTTDGTGTGRRWGSRVFAAACFPHACSTAKSGAGLRPSPAHRLPPAVLL